MKLKKLLAGGICAVLTVSAVPLTAFAAEEPAAETVTADWIPKSFAEAYRFADSFGRVKVQDDLICIVRRSPYRSQVEDPIFCEAGEGSGLIDTALYSLELPVRPDRNDYESEAEYSAAMKEFEAACNAIGLSPSFLEEAKNTECFCSVSVIRLLPEDTASVRLSRNADPAYTFAADADGKITETDIFGWLPDCFSEYRAYEQEHPGFSLHDDLIVYCGSVNHSTGMEHEISQKGSAKLELMKTVICSPYELIAVVGGGTCFINVFRAVTPGTVAISAKSYIPWAPEESASVQTAGYQVTEEGVSVISEAEVRGLSGDCNADSTWSVADLVMLQKWLLCDGELTDWRSADLSGDGRVNAADLALLKQKLLDADAFAEIAFVDLPESLDYSNYVTQPIRAQVTLREGVSLAEDEELVVMLCNPDRNELIMMADNGVLRDGDKEAGDGIWSCAAILNAEVCEEPHFVVYAAVRKTGSLAEIRSCSQVASIRFERIPAPKN